MESSPMKSQNHIHRYKKVNLSREKDKEYLVYKCVKPLCSHYVPIALVEGQMCECNKCSEPMLITKKVLTHSSNKPMARPHCPNCIVRKNAKQVAALADFIAGNKA
jgi:hypothetical protein